MGQTLCPHDLGREITRAALDAGETVVATARSLDAFGDAFEGEHDRLHALALDITDAEAANAVAAETVERFGAIDVLVNNAGYAELGFFETFTMPQCGVSLRSTCSAR